MELVIKLFFIGFNFFYFLVAAQWFAIAANMKQNFQNIDRKEEDNNWLLIMRYVFNNLLFAFPHSWFYSLEKGLFSRAKKKNWKVPQSDIVLPVQELCSCDSNTKMENKDKSRRLARCVELLLLAQRINFSLSTDIFHFLLLLLSRTGSVAEDIFVSPCCIAFASILHFNFFFFIDFYVPLIIAHNFIANGLKIYRVFYHLVNFPIVNYWPRFLLIAARIFSIQLRFYWAETLYINYFLMTYY